MNSPRAALRVASFVFALVFLVHLWRLLGHADIRIGSYDVPMWPSAVAAVVTGILSLWLWRVSAGKGA